MLRRDDPELHSVRVLVGRAKGVSGALVPLFMACADENFAQQNASSLSDSLVPDLGNPVMTNADVTMVSTLRVLVILTLQLKGNAPRIPAVIEVMRKFKEEMINADFLEALGDFISDPLVRLQEGGYGASQTRNDVIKIECVLSLVRNLLLIDANARNKSGVSSAGNVSTHDLLLRIMFSTGLAKLFIVAVQVCGEFQSFAKFLLDIFFLMFHRQTPEELAACTEAEEKPEEEPAPEPRATAEVDILASPTMNSLMDISFLDDPEPSQSQKPNTSKMSAEAQALCNSLTHTLNKIKAQGNARDNTRAQRNSRFAKPFLVKEMHQQYLSKEVPRTGRIAFTSPTKAKGKEMIVSKHRVTKLPKAFTSKSTTPRDVLLQLKEFAKLFVQSGYTLLYGVVTDMLNSSDDAFRESFTVHDQLSRLWLIYFFTAFYIDEETAKQKKDSSYALNVLPVVCSVNMENFTYTVNCIDEFYSSLTAPTKSAPTMTILALSEMFEVAHIMLTQSDQEMKDAAEGIMLNLFHDPETLLTRVPALITKYNPKTRPLKELEALCLLGENLLSIISTVISSGTKILVDSSRKAATTDSSHKRKKKEDRMSAADRAFVVDDDAVIEDGTEQPVAQEPAQQSEEPADKPSEEPAEKPAEPPKETDKDDDLLEPINLEKEHENAQKQAEKQDNGLLDDIFQDDDQEQAYEPAPEKAPEEPSKEPESRQDNDAVVEMYSESDSERDEEMDPFQSQLQYRTQLAYYSNNSVIGNLCLLVARSNALSSKYLTSLTSMLSRLAKDMPESTAFFWEASLFCIFDKFFDTLDEQMTTDKERNELIGKLADNITHIVGEFFANAARDPTLFVRVFTWRTMGINREMAGIVKEIGKKKKQAFRYEDDDIDVNDILASEDEDEIVLPRRNLPKRRATKGITLDDDSSSSDGGYFPSTRKRAKDSDDEDFRPSEKAVDDDEAPKKKKKKRILSHHEERSAVADEPMEAPKKPKTKKLLHRAEKETTEDDLPDVDDLIGGMDLIDDVMDGLFANDEPAADN